MEVHVVEATCHVHTDAHRSAVVVGEHDLLDTGVAQLFLGSLHEGAIVGAEVFVVLEQQRMGQAVGGELDQVRVVAEEVTAARAVTALAFGRIRSRIEVHLPQLFAGDVASQADHGAGTGSRDLLEQFGHVGTQERDERTEAVVGDVDLDLRVSGGLVGRNEGVGHYALSLGDGRVDRKWNIDVANYSLAA